MAIIEIEEQDMIKWGVKFFNLGYNNALDMSIKSCKTAKKFEAYKIAAIHTIIEKEMKKDNYNPTAERN